MKYEFSISSSDYVLRADETLARNYWKRIFSLYLVAEGGKEVKIYSITGLLIEDHNDEYWIFTSGSPEAYDPKDECNKAAKAAALRFLKRTWNTE